jgi:hypothetical protein
MEKKKILKLLFISLVTVIIYLFYSYDRKKEQRIEEQRIEEQRIEEQRIEEQRIEEQRIEEQRIEKEESITIWKRIKLFLMSFYIIDYSLKSLLIIYILFQKSRFSINHKHVINHKDGLNKLFISFFICFCWFIISLFISMRLRTSEFIKIYEKVSDYFFLSFFLLFILNNFNYNYRYDSYNQCFFNVPATQRFKILFTPLFIMILMF